MNNALGTETSSAIENLMRDNKKHNILRNTKLENNQP